VLSVITLISGSGSNLRALLEAADNPLFPAKVLAVGSDKPAAGLAHAEQFGVPTFVAEPRRFTSAAEWSECLLGHIQFFKPDLVVLAGFMRILPAEFVAALSPRLINLHPSLLPLYPGAHAVRDALAAGATETGTTIHVVDAGVDSGPVIAQRSLSILPGETEESLHGRIRELEHELLIATVRDIAEGTLDLNQIAAGANIAN
jgi:phosphoribosylglycinamide formyltransferase-1